MADLSVAYMYQCESQTRTTVMGSDGLPYHLYKTNGRWECSCKGFQFRGACKHVKQVETQGCCWHQQFDGGEPKEVNGEKVCPECGGPVEVVKVGV